MDYQCSLTGQHLICSGEDHKRTRICKDINVDRVALINGPTIFESLQSALSFHERERRGWGGGGCE